MTRDESGRVARLTARALRDMKQRAAVDRLSSTRPREVAQAFDPTQKASCSGFVLVRVCWAVRGRQAETFQAPVFRAHRGRNDGGSRPTGYNAARCRLDDLGAVSGGIPLKGTPADGKASALQPCGVPIEISEQTAPQPSVQLRANRRRQAEHLRRNRHRGQASLPGAVARRPSEALGPGRNAQSTNSSARSSAVAAGPVAMAACKQVARISATRMASWGVVFASHLSIRESRAQSLRA